MFFGQKLILRDPFIPETKLLLATVSAYTLDRLAEVGCRCVFAWLASQDRMDGCRVKGTDKRIITFWP
jgi:hypothetical protein